MRNATESCSPWITARAAAAPKIGCCYRPYWGCCGIVRVGVAVGLSFAWSCPGVPGAGWRSSGLAGEGCQGGGGEVAAGDGLAEVADGGGEGPFAGCPGQAADRQAADALVVLEVAVEGLADVAAPAVGGDAARGGQPGGHRRDGRGSRCRRRAGGAGGFLQGAAPAGGDEPVRPG